MTCNVLRDPKGQLLGIACTRERPRRKCNVCHARPATRLCDYPTGKGKTCDCPLCVACARRIGVDRDHCPSHPVCEFLDQLPLPGMEPK